MTTKLGDGPTRSLPRRIARAIAWPARRVFEPSFGLLAAEVERTNEELARRMTSLVEGHADSIASLTEETHRLVGRVEELRNSLGERVEELRDALGERISPLAQSVWLDRTMAKGLDALDDEQANFLNFAASHLGFSAQRELYFNWPVNLRYSKGDVEAASINERLVEVPYALRALAGLPVGASIMDVGSSESTVAVSLASLGYLVTAVDLRPYPFKHPNLAAVASPLDDLDMDPDSFDAVISISSIEHFGLGSYGSAVIPNADQAAMARFAQLLRPDGRLILTVPFGVASVDEFQRVYDLEGLTALLDDWQIIDLTVAEQRSPLEWRVVDDPGDAPRPERGYVAMVTASVGTTPGLT